jgi:hypothetical protein
MQLPHDFRHSRSIYCGFFLHSPWFAQPEHLSSVSIHGILNGSASKQIKENKSSSVGKHSVFIVGSKFNLESDEDDDDDTVQKSTAMLIIMEKGFTKKPA